ncbi:MAG TPA: GNAT family protein [Gemmataceae bacterium]|nr:GNAT family protein [Gemmataceae bacterium]
MDPQPISLAGRHVRLEPLTPRHAPELLAALNLDPSVWQWLPVAPPTTLAEMEAMVVADLQAQADGAKLIFTQIEAPTGRIVGSTTYLDISRRDRRLEIGSTWIAKAWQRTGINTEAKFLLLRHAFEDLGAVRVQLKTDRRNLQSQAAIERLGAVREGILRNHMIVQNGFIRDSVMYSITNEEWTSVRTHLQAKLLR